MPCISPVKSLFHLLLVGVLFTAAPLSTHAVVMWGGNGSQNTAAPANDFGFANVGKCFSPTDGFFESCVYLEGNWVISAYHTVRDQGATGFSLGQVIFNDPVTGPATFAPVPGSGVRLRNADNTFTDLAVFQITAVPAFLDKVVIASQTPAVGSSLSLAGNGLSRQPALIEWDVNTATTPDTWTEVATGGDEQGHKLIPAPAEIRWATNTLENNGPLPIPGTPTTIINAGYGAVTSIRTDFDEISGQAQGVAGDSGGGVFYERGASWELLGVIVVRDYKDGQPEFSAVSGNSTYAAHLPSYRSQIVATIPEPTTAGLIIAGAAVSLFRRHRKAS